MVDRFQEFGFPLGVGVSSPDVTNCSLPICGSTLTWAGAVPNEMVVTDGNGLLTTIPFPGPGNPALPLNSVQFNNAGAFGGTAKFEWDNVLERLSVNNVLIDDNEVYVQGVTLVQLNSMGTIGISANLGWDVVSGPVNFLLDGAFDIDTTSGPGGSTTWTTQDFVVNAAGNIGLDNNATGAALINTQTFVVSSTVGDATITSAAGVTLNANGGDITLNPSANLECTTLVGDIDLSAVTGTMFLAGNVTQLSAITTMELTSEAMTLATNGDNLTVNTTAGDVDINVQGGFFVDTTAAVDLSADTELNLTASANDMTLLAINGNIALDTATGNTIITSSLGNIQFNAANGTVSAAADVLNFSGVTSADLTTPGNLTLQGEGASVNILASGVATDLNLIASVDVNLDAPFGEIDLSANRVDIQVTSGGEFYVETFGGDFVFLPSGNLTSTATGSHSFTGQADFTASALTGDMMLSAPLGTVALSGTTITAAAGAGLQLVGQPVAIVADNSDLTLQAIDGNVEVNGENVTITRNGAPAGTIDIGTTLPTTTINMGNASSTPSINGTVDASGGTITWTTGDGAFTVTSTSGVITLATSAAINVGDYTFDADGNLERNGADLLFFPGGVDNMVLGQGSFPLADAVIAQRNLVVGSGSFTSATTVVENTIVGNNCATVFVSDAAGDNLTVVGYGAASSMLQGRNTVLGEDAAQGFINGRDNVFLGRLAGSGAGNTTNCEQSTFLNSTGSADDNRVTRLGHRQALHWHAYGLGIRVQPTPATTGPGNTALTEAMFQNTVVVHTINVVGDQLDVNPGIYNLVANTIEQLDDNDAFELTIINIGPSTNPVQLVDGSAVATFVGNTNVAAQTSGTFRFRFFTSLANLQIIRIS